MGYAMIMKNGIGAIRENIRRHGFLRGSGDIFYRLLNKCMVARGYYTIAVTPETLITHRSNESVRYSYGFMEKRELKEYCKPEYDLDDKFLSDAFRNGHLCYVILDGDELVSYNWFSERRTMLTENLQLLFGEEYIYHYKSFTHPKHRGEGMFQVGASKALGEIFSDGKKKGALGINPMTNFASFKANSKIGYFTFGRAFVVGFGDRLIAYQTGDYEKFQCKIEVIVNV
jgi:hypothetical protein